MIRRALLLAAIAFGAAGPARADDDACAAIIRAVRSVDSAPTVHSKMIATDPARRRPFESDQIIIGDIAWTTPPEGGTWMKVRISATDRASLSAGLVRYPPTDCAALPPEPLGGLPMQVYTYRQIVPGPGTVESRLWVGEQDKLPHAYEGRAGDVKTRVTMSYTGVVAPIGD
ncbi:MAG: hypothetical protein JOZ42_12360 [Acetobacteraceae bacterium]|nr:hypothetical protein [Acetobacteraceae bacterium]